MPKIQGNFFAFTYKSFGYSTGVIQPGCCKQGNSRRLFLFPHTPSKNNYMSSDNKNNPPFYIGQEVVAVRDHSCLHFKKGEKFFITGILEGCCGWNVSVGIIKNTGLCYCKNCGKTVIRFKNSYRNETFYSVVMFAPVSRLRISEHLTIAEGLAVDAVEERTDVKEIVNA